MFMVHPAKRFAAEYNVPEILWHELYRRYQLLEYTVPELCEYYHISAGKMIKRKYLYRWIFMTEIYTLTKPARDKGAQAVSSEIFGNKEQKVINELTRHMRTGSTKNSRALA